MIGRVGVIERGGVREIGAEEVSDEVMESWEKRREKGIRKERGVMCVKKRISLGLCAECRFIFLTRRGWERQRKRSQTRM